MKCEINRKPSQVIRDAIHRDDITGVSVETLLHAFGRQSFGFIFVLMGLPMIVPLPPGVGFLPALLITIWALQGVFGQGKLWLPKFIGKRMISPAFLRKVEHRALPVCEKLERRYCFDSQTPVIRLLETRIATLMVAAMGLLIMLPTPFMNLIPAAIILSMGLAILGQNRKLLWLNISLGVIAAGFIGSTVYVGLELLLD